ncbi:hypothetical protein [Porphyrobacter sp. ULC335]|jgi:hypothetical protein|uniref:hypothetical protein n=1 Tax=Porphyrobacter sp. ULC335 TaxID=2854260 RepID=UPI00221EA697|nr:hypothetical protein [Porphyrobacter sp. ULC335]UYV16243.1 hypothetical protein KVF90_02595 [Porphyrobacter sp. ULC335]
MMTLVTAGALLWAPAVPISAQPADLTPEATAAHLAEVGSWRFETRAKRSDGKAVCAEVWRFNADGTALIESGEERVTKRWRTEAADGDRWLYTTSLTTNGAPDCMGSRSEPADYPKDESGFVLMFFNSGIALTCEPPATFEGPDGKPARLVSDESCWGSLAPLPKG